MVKAIPENYRAGHRLLGEGHWQIDYTRGLVVRRTDGLPYRCSWPDRYICISLPKRADLPTGKLLAHRLIWESVHGELDPVMTVNHLDGNKQNNVLANLEAVTQAENVNHALSTGLRTAPSGGAHPCTSLSDQQAAEIYRRVGAGEMQTALAREFNVGKNVIWRIANGLSFASATNHAA